MSNPFFVNIHTHPTSTFTLHTTTTTHHTHPQTLQVHLSPSHLTVAVHSTPAPPAPAHAVPEYSYATSGSTSGSRTPGGFARRELAAHPDDMYRVGRYDGSQKSWEILAKRVKGLDAAGGSGAGESSGERERGRGYGSGRSRRR